MADNYITNYNGSITALSDNIDVNGKSIQGAEVNIRTNASNGDVNIDANGTGNVVLSGLKYPNSDGNPNDVLITDSFGNLSFAPQSAGGAGSGSYYWQIAADDSTEIRVLSDNTIKFIGGTGLTSASDAQGNITFNQVSNDFSLTGEATASAVSYDGTGNVALSVTLDHNALDTEYLRLDGTTQPAGALNFNGQNVTNAGAITATSFTGPLTGNTTGYHTGDVKGSVVADDSTLIVDAVGGGVPFTRILNKPTNVAGYGITDALALSSLSVGADASASGSGGIAFNDGTGVFTYTPPDLSDFPTLTGTNTLTNKTLTDPAITLNDSTALNLGTDSDATISYNGTNTTFSQTTNGGEMFIIHPRQVRIDSSDGLNSTSMHIQSVGSTRIRFYANDAGNEKLGINQNGVYLLDAVNLTFGTGNTIAGAGANALDVASQTLTLKANTFTVKNFADDNTLLSANNGGNVHLYYNNVAKLNTSADGVAVTGELEVSTNLNVTGDIGSANLTNGRITFATTNGVLTDNPKLTWNGATLDVNGTVDATTVETEGLTITQNDISGTRSNENLTIAANGTGKVQIDDPIVVGATLETTIGSDGSAAGLPAAPAQYLKINVNGTDYKIPLYLIS